MQLSRFTISCLLILALIPLAINNSVYSQQYTTNTISQTITAEVTSYSTVTQSSIIQVVLPRELYSNSIYYILDKTLNLGIGGGSQEGQRVAGCTDFPMYAQLQSGQSVILGITSDKPISLYVMTAAAFSTWNQTGRCAASSTLQTITRFTSYALNWVAPADGTYYVVFLNYNSGLAIIKIDLSGLITSTTRTQSIAYYTTEIIPSLQVKEVSPLQSNIGLILVGVAVIAAVAVIAFVLPRYIVAKRKHTR